MSRESDFYAANVDRVIGSRLVHHAALAVRVAQAESRNYPDLELDAVPPLRRLNFQSALLFGTFPRGTNVVREEHPGGAHVAIVSGGVTITSLTRSHMPRRVEFQPYQQTLAEEGQLQLFEPAGQGASDKLWSLLIYGGDFRSTKLTLCRMTFPTPTGYFAPGTIDLLADFPEVVAMFDDEEYASEQVITFLAMRAGRVG